MEGDTEARDRAEISSCWTEGKDMVCENEERQRVMAVESAELNAAHWGMSNEPTGYVCNKRSGVEKGNRQYFWAIFV